LTSGGGGFGGNAGFPMVGGLPPLFTLTGCSDSTETIDALIGCFDSLGATWFTTTEFNT